MEGSSQIYEQLLGELRERIPEIAIQVEEEVQRGRRVAATALSGSDRTDRDEKLRFAGSKISKEDLATVEYSGDEKLALLIDSLLRLGTSMATSREAILGLLGGTDTSTTIELVVGQTGALAARIDLATEVPGARTAIERHRPALVEALAELGR
jgi:hypothetical protein